MNESALLAGIRARGSRTQPPDRPGGRLRFFVLGLALFVASHAAITPTRAESEGKPTIAVLDFELNDLTLTPNLPEELARTASIAPLLRQLLKSQYGFEPVEIDSATREAADKSVGYLFDHHDIAATLGRAADSDWIVVGRVHKASFLFVYLKVHVINSKANRLISNLAVEIKGPQQRMTIKGVESLAEQIVEAIRAEE